MSNLVKFVVTDDWLEKFFLKLNLPLSRPNSDNCPVVLEVTIESWSHFLGLTHA